MDKITSLVCTIDVHNARYLTVSHGSSKKAKRKAETLAKVCPGADTMWLNLETVDDISYVAMVMGRRRRQTHTLGSKLWLARARLVPSVMVTLTQALHQISKERSSWGRILHLTSCSRILASPSLDLVSHSIHLNGRATWTASALPQRIRMKVL